jgi:hypothetical protein
MLETGGCPVPGEEQKRAVSVYMFGLLVCVSVRCLLKRALLGMKSQIPVNGARVFMLKIGTGYQPKAQKAGSSNYSYH